MQRPYSGWCNLGMLRRTSTSMKLRSNTNHTWCLDAGKWKGLCNLGPGAWSHSRVERKLAGKIVYSLMQHTKSHASAATLSSKVRESLDVALVNPATITKVSTCHILWIVSDNDTVSCLSASEELRGYKCLAWQTKQVRKFASKCVSQWQHTAQGGKAYLLEVFSPLRWTLA